MADGSQVDYQRDGKVGIITLSREPLNTYDDAFDHEFQQAWIRAKHDDSRVVVLRATGKHFCAGAELKDPRPAPAGRRSASRMGGDPSHQVGREADDRGRAGRVHRRRPANGLAV